MANQHKDVMGRSHRHTIILDWDGTCVEAKWPDMGDWMPGAKEAIRTFHENDIKLMVFSARLNPYDPYTFQKRDAGEVATELFKVRQKLDEAGLHFVDIWTLGGKPGGSVYIDDRAERYNGTKGSWRALTEKVLVRLGKDLPELPAFESDELG